MLVKFQTCVHANNSKPGKLRDYIFSGKPHSPKNFPEYLRSNHKSPTNKAHSGVTLSFTALGKEPQPLEEFPLLPLATGNGAPEANGVLPLVAAKD